MVSPGKEAVPMNKDFQKLLQVLATIGSVACFLLWLSKRR